MPDHLNEQKRRRKSAEIIIVSFGEGYAEFDSHIPRLHRHNRTWRQIQDPVRV